MQYLYKLIQIMYHKKKQTVQFSSVQLTIHISSRFIDSISDQIRRKTQNSHLFVYKLLRGNHWFYIITNEEKRKMTKGKKHVWTDWSVDEDDDDGGV